MIEHLFSVACQSAAIDQFTNTLSIQSIIENLTAESTAPVPVTQPAQGIPFPVTIVSVWFNSENSEVSGEQSLSILGPNGIALTPHIEGFNIKPFSTHRMMASIPAFPYMGDGLYRVLIRIKKGSGWEDVARIPISVAVVVKNLEAS